MALTDEIRRAHELADESVERMKECLSADDRAGFYANLRDYVCRRFFIEGLADGEDDLVRLSELSIERIFELTGGSGLGGDVSLTCTGASSVQEKIILAELTVQRKLGVHLDPFKAAYIETVSELADALFSGFERKKAPSEQG